MMKINKNTSDKPFRAIIGIDHGDTKHAICFTDRRGTIRREYSIPNTRKQLEKLALEYPKAFIAMEVGTHSPWISRLLQKLYSMRFCPLVRFVS
ncbi:MAG: transposase [Rubritalea sp.]|jgi:transposase